MFAATLLVLLGGCKKDKENAAVVEEVPAVAPKETDTSATLAEEPSLQQVGTDKPGSAKDTFHPGKGKGAVAPAASEAGFSDAGRFVVQVAIFKSKKQAAALVEKLSAQGYPAYVAEVTDPVPQLSGSYHRVRIGKFLKIADAKAFGDNTLKPLGYDYWVDNKKNDRVGGSGGGVSEPTSEPAAAPDAEAPAPRKGKKAKAVAAEPSEPSTPPSGTWGAPKADEAAPTSDSWSNTGAAEAPAAKPADKSAAASELPANPAPAPAEPAPATPSSAAAPAATAPAPAAKTDTGKVNLDEW